MDIVKLYQDYNIPFRASGHKHCRPGWVQTKCPFCTGNPGWHLGFCISRESTFYNRFVCWRCGGKGTFRTLARLANLDGDDVKTLLKQYGGEIPTEVTPTRARIKRVGLKRFRFPSLTQEDLPKMHRAYLTKRNFDPDKLQKEWQLKATGIVSYLDDLDFGRRIIVPITNVTGEIVSFQARDVTNKHKLKYLTCPMDREKEHHKHLLFGLEQIGNLDTIVVTEGIFDVMRLGAPAVCGFGIRLLTEQVRILAQFRRVVMLFDPDPQAWEQAEAIQSRLQLAGVDVICQKMENSDPADLSDRESKQLMRELTKRFH